MFLVTNVEFHPSSDLRIITSSCMRVILKEQTATLLFQLPFFFFLALFNSTPRLSYICSSNTHLSCIGFIISLDHSKYLLKLLHGIRFLIVYFWAHSSPSLDGTSIEQYFLTILHLSPLNTYRSFLIFVPKMIKM